MKETSSPYYKKMFDVTKTLLGPFCRVISFGNRNVPGGAAVVFSNHSHWSDPVLMAFALGKLDQLCFMGKEELFKIPVFGDFARKMGSFPVRRGQGDRNSLDQAEKVLKSGKKVGIFPEGTRTKADGAVRAHGGFIRIAERAKAPLVPMWVDRSRSIFKPTTIVIGEPIDIENERDTETGRINYPAVARKLMNRVWELKERYLSGAVNFAE